MKTLATFLLMCSAVACMDTADDLMMLTVAEDEIAVAVETMGSDVLPSAEDEAAKLEAMKKASTLEGSLAAACGKVGPNVENRRVNDASSPNHPYLRLGSSTSCDPAGQINPSDDAIYFCFTRAGDYTWTYLRSLTSGIKGWVRDDLLRLNPNGSRGSVKGCGF